MTQTEQDWSRIVGGWIKEAERQMDAAYRADDGQAYAVAARWRDEMVGVRRQLDPTAREAWFADGLPVPD